MQYKGLPLQSSLEPQFVFRCNNLFNLLSLFNKVEPEFVKFSVKSFIDDNIVFVKGIIIGGSAEIKHELLRIKYFEYIDLNKNNNNNYFMEFRTNNKRKILKNYSV